MKNRLAVIDYGVGGLDLFKRIKQLQPEIGLTYFSDSGEIPYGQLSKDRLYKRIQRVIDFLKKDGAHQIVIACHAASSVSSYIRGKGVIDIIPSSTTEITTGQIQNLGIIGGGRIIYSGIYRKYFENQGIKVIQRIAQPLSILIEKGDIDSPQVDIEIARILKPVRKVDALLLACTHYPVLKNKIQSYLGSHCEIIDPIEHLVKKVQPSLSQRDKMEDVFYTTGNKALMKQVAQSIYGLTITKICHISS